ncbi:MAG: flippase-like domain-containing protein, partial [Phycisphaerales bacterium]|nr:flippase-like domain-containing protein [Phycisphaerales bacterium]
PRDIWRTLWGADLRLVALSLSLTIPMAQLKGARWRAIVGSYGLRLSLGEAVSMHAMGMVMAAVTPGRVGDFAKIVPLVNRGWTRRRAIACSALDRLWDVAFILLIGYAAMWYFSSIFLSQILMASIFAAATLIVGALVVAYRRPIGRWLVRRLPEKQGTLAGDLWTEFQTGFVKHPAPRSALIVLTTAACWPIYFLAVYLCARAVDVHVPYVYMCACVATATALSFLPITVAGAGTRDAVFILLLGRIGAERPESLAVSSIVLAMFLANALIFWAIWILLRPAPVVTERPSDHPAPHPDSDSPRA